MSVHFDFSKKHVWVIGAGQGIGLEIANSFSDAGAHVVGFDIKFSLSNKYTFETVALDIANHGEVQYVTKKVLLKNSRLDILVNAAGILTLGQTDELDLKAWQRCFDVNVTGSFNLFQQVMPVFRQQRCGSIVIVASNSAHVPRIGMSAYGASKSALCSLTQSVGLELANYGVRCNLVSPGSTKTEMLSGMLMNADGEQQLIAGLPHHYKLGVPLQKIAKPREIASTVLFLASDAASHITLQDVVVDGGATLGA